MAGKFRQSFLGELGYVALEAGPITSKMLGRVQTRVLEAEARINDLSNSSILRNTGTALIAVRKNTAAVDTGSRRRLNFIEGTGVALTVADDPASDEIDVTVAASGLVAATRTLTAGAGLTGGGDLSADRTFDVGAGTGITVASDTVAVDQTFSPTWTGTHTFNTNRATFNAGISLGTNGTAWSSVADGAGAIGFDLNDQVTRTQGFEFQIRNGATKFMETTWDGRFSFGYGGNVAVQPGHVLAFVANDANNATGTAHYVGILGFINHSDTTETATKLIGVCGVGVVQATTGLSANLVAGVIGTGVSSGTLTTANGKVLAGVVGKVIGSSALADNEPASPDVVATGTGARTVRMNFDHATCFWADYIAHNNTVALPTAAQQPLIGSSARLVIQGFPGTAAAATPNGQAWGIYGDAPSTGSASNYPAITGFMRVPYPRRTGGTGVRAMQIFYEPWPNTAGIRAGAIEGDTYFDDGTNFRDGLWEYAGGAWHKLLQTQAVDALGGGAAPTLGTIGGTGPAAAAQAAWIQVVGTNGTTYWIPVWV